jgi:peptidyl-dipeptidase Dcp
MKADVLVADAFAAFVETGDVFNVDVAARYMHEVLEAAGTRSMNESYLAFRGRMPSVDALLQQRGFLPQ